MSRLTLDYGDSIYSNCSLFSPPLKSVNGELVSAECIEIFTIDDNPSYFILPYIKNKYSSRIGFMVTKNDFTEWKLGTVELGELISDKSKWYKFHIPSSLQLWRISINPEIAFISMSNCSKPNKSYMKSIPINAIRAE